jgi:hypothetical protein
MPELSREQFRAHMKEKNLRQRRAQGKLDRRAEYREVQKTALPHISKQEMQVKLEKHHAKFGLPKNAIGQRNTLVYMHQTNPQSIVDLAKALKELP